MLKITCPSCGKCFHGEDSLRGKRVYCPACNASITVAQASQDAPSSAIANPEHATQAKVTPPKKASDEAFSEGSPPLRDARVRTIRKNTPRALTRVGAILALVALLLGSAVVLGFFFGLGQVQENQGGGAAVQKDPVPPQRPMPNENAPPPNEIVMPLMVPAKPIVDVVPPMLITPDAELPIKKEAELSLISSDGRWVYLRKPMANRAEGQEELIGLPNGPRVALDWDYRNPCSFSPDGKFFVGPRDKHWRLWSLDDEAAERTLCEVSSENRSIHFSPDSQQLAIASDRHASRVPFLQIWDVKTGVLQSSVQPNDLFGEAAGNYFSLNVEWGGDQTFFMEKTILEDQPPDQRSHSESVCCWDVRKAQVRFRVDNLADGGYRRPTWAISPDGKRCVAIVAAKSSRRVVLAHLFPGSKKNETSIPTDPMVQVWDVLTGKLLWQRPFAPEHGWFHLSFTPDSRHVAICSRDFDRNGLVEFQLWDVEASLSRKVMEKQANGKGEFTLSSSGRLCQYDERPVIVNGPWPKGAAPQIVGGWWEIREKDVRPVHTFDDDGNWFDRQANRHALFTEAEKNEQIVRGQRRAHMKYWGRYSGIEVPGVVANLSQDERWLAMRLAFSISKDQPRRIGSNRPEFFWRHELHLVDLQDGSESPIIQQAQYWLFARDGKTLITAGDEKLRVWTLPLRIR